MTDARVTQAPLEVAYTATSAAVRASQAAVEAAYAVFRDVRLSQFVIEVAYLGTGTVPPGPAVGSHRCRPDVICVHNRVANKKGAVYSRAKRVGSVFKRTNKPGSAA